MMTLARFLPGASPAVQLPPLQVTGQAPLAGKSKKRKRTTQKTPPAPSDDPQKTLPHAQSGPKTQGRKGISQPVAQAVANVASASQLEVV